ncbi:MAG TPA: hypothetical protein PLY87_15840, partial [Planctomycetaceae bacterium]|nr:hypothetical protein [Planctomycetaceae bacterium]
MDAQHQTRSCRRERGEVSQTAPRGSRQIVTTSGAFTLRPSFLFPFSHRTYHKNWLHNLLASAS